MSARVVAGLRRDRTARTALTVIVLYLEACGSSSPPEPTEPTKVAVVKKAEPSEEELAEKERVERAAIVARHRELESASQDALAASCKDTEAWSKQHCTPTCYPGEPPDARKGKKLAGPVEIQHHVCQPVLGDEQFGAMMVIDEIGTKLRARKHRGRFPKAHKKSAWQAEVATWFRDASPIELPRRDVVVVADKKWRDVRHPITQETMRCVTVSHYTRSVRGKLGDCGATKKTVCEAAGNAYVRGMNFAQYRLSEAKQLQATGKEDECLKAAHEAVAAARGLPRWRQYQKLNLGKWTEGLAYKTRFNGLLDEDKLFEVATTLATEAQGVYAACGGSPKSPTTPQQEQSFHSCP